MCVSYIYFVSCWRMRMDAIRVVMAWHRAVNAGDPDEMTRWVSPDVEVAGPRGTAHGITMVKDWITRSGIRLEPRQVYHRGDKVIVQQAARWPDPDQGDDALTPPVSAFTAFQIRDRQITRIARTDSLPAALEVVGLSEDDLATGWTSTP
jgi:ketosteroid isomerase-like protein